MSKTLRFGTDPIRLGAAKKRTGRVISPRRSPNSFDAARAAEDAARALIGEERAALARRRMAFLQG